MTGGQLGLLFNAETAEVLYEHHSPLNCGVTFESEGRNWSCIGTYTGEILIFQLIDDSLNFYKKIGKNSNLLCIFFWK